MSFFVKDGPKRSRDLERILNLPERDALELGREICEPLTELLKTENGEQTLWPLQATCLVEAHDIGGVVALLSVGEGKTLVSYLLPVVLEAKKPLLLVPAKLKQKTIREFEQLAGHWKKHPNIRIESYEMVSRKPTLLDDIGPDLVVCDEAHNLKNKKAGCTKRVWKYWYKNEKIKIISMSGTLTTRSFFDWWHLQLMALPDGLSVLPYDWREMEKWSRALDEKIEDRIGLGALSVFGDDYKKAREGYGAKMRKTPGIVVSEAQSVKASIYLELEKFEDHEIDKFSRYISRTWELPNGTEIMAGSDLWRHQREVANGFYYYWVEPGPKPWMDARRECFAFVRRTLNYSRRYETPSQVMEAYNYKPEIENWVEIRDTFTPVTVPQWFTSNLIEYAAAQTKKSNAILWFEHDAVGKALKIAGLPVFGSGGLEIELGFNIELAAGKPIAASVGSCGEGFNLQGWNHNIVVNCSPSGRVWEQLIGRTHRSGQNADFVHFKSILSSDVQFDDFVQAYADAEYIQATTGQRQKLLVADILSDQEWRRE